MTTITDIKPIDFNDKTVVKNEINDFCSKYAYADVEHALEISPSGNTYSLIGTKGIVNSEIIGKDVLKGSISAHNHPVETGKDRYDSFSIYDLKFANRNKAGKQYLISGERRNVFELTKYYAEAELDKAWQTAKDKVYERAEKGEIDLDYWEQEEILKVLNDTLEGFKFYENF